MSKRICIVTGSRAEYGLLKPLINELRSYNHFKVDVVVTGSHFESRYGNTISMIEDDGVEINARIVPSFPTTSHGDIVKAMSAMLLGFNDYLDSTCPDIVLFLGDRYELLVIASAATIHRIPIGHIHGGELTIGAFDDSIRNALTKLSHLHFTSHPEYSKRVIQMGERPSRVHCVGALAFDSIKNSKKMTKSELEASLGVRFESRILIVTLHPETLRPGSTESNVACLLKAIESESDTSLIFTGANADPEGDKINRMFQDFTSTKVNAHFVPSLGSDNYYSLLNLCDGVVGNSSSGIIESPFFGKPAVNIGERQRGRVQGENVVNCSFSLKDIKSALEQIKDPNFLKLCSTFVNPYERGSTSKQISSIIQSLEWKALLQKEFCDLA